MKDINDAYRVALVKCSQYDIRGRSSQTCSTCVIQHRFSDTLHAKNCHIFSPNPSLGMFISPPASGMGE
jgi:hypothetical protein